MKLLRRATPTTPVPPPPPKVVEALTTRRLEVIVEREWAHQVLSGSTTSPASFEAHCATCGTRMPMFTPPAAALIAHVTVRTIYRWVDEKKLHFIESPAGDLYLCARSFLAPPLKLHYRETTSLRRFTVTFKLFLTPHLFSLFLTGILLRFGPR